jgi:hypothetical protein
MQPQTAKPSTTGNMNWLTRMKTIRARLREIEARLTLYMVNNFSLDGLKSGRAPGLGARFAAKG